MRFRTSFLITLLFNLSILVIDKGAGFIILWILQDVPDQKGGLILLTSLPPILMAVSNLGLASSLLFFVKRGEVSVRTAGQTTSMVALVWGFFVALLAFAGIQVWAWMNPDVSIPEWGLLAAVLATPPFLLLISYRNSIQLALQKIFAYNLVHLVPSVAFLPLFLVLYYFVTDRDPYYAGVYGKFLPVILIAVVLAYHLRAKVPLRPSFDRSFFKKALSYGWRASVNSTLGYLNHRIDLYLVGMLFIVATVPNASMAEVGYYGLAVSLAELIWYFPEAMRDLLFSKVAGSSHDEARQFTPVVCRNSFLICLVGGIAIWFLHDPLLGLYMTDRWHTLWGPRVTPALAFLLPGTVFFTINKVLMADVMGRGKINVGLFVSTLVFATMIIGDVLLIPEHGARGAAIASTIAYSVGAICIIQIYRGITGASLRDLLLVRGDDLVHYFELLGRLRTRHVRQSRS